MTDPLEKLFGSSGRVKLMRLFLFNPEHPFSLKDAAGRVRVKEREATKEIKLLLHIKFLRRAGRRFVLNQDFAFLDVLRTLLLNAPARGKDLFEKLRPAGSVKLVVLAGIFMGEWESRLDLLVVGDRLEEKKLRVALGRLEGEVGKELRYAVLTSEDFGYRRGMNDHLLRDVFDYPHRVVYDRLNTGLL